MPTGQEPVQVPNARPEPAQEQQEEKPLGFFDKMKNAYNDAVDHFTGEEGEPEN